MLLRSIVSIAFVSCISMLLIWLIRDRKYQSINTVATAYDKWTKDQLLERLWGEHIHLGFYDASSQKMDFREAKVAFVHKLVQWSGLDQLPKGSRILDVGCGIGGSTRILAKDYGFEIIGISISSAQVRRASELTSDQLTCSFQVMDALDLNFPESTFDGVWSVEVGPHIQDKQKYADELLRVLRPGGVLAVADWNKRNLQDGEIVGIEKWVMRQLLNQWAHPEFASISGFKMNLLRSPFCGGGVDTEDWTRATLPSWNESIMEGIRRPKAVFGLGLFSVIKGLREIPTILLMRWAFAKGLMRFGVFRSRG
ncbi:methyltransferase domain-containing protein [Prochlorococcus sp. MIT 1300]|uniref:methyltransferase domain-containing protein n=1 Tax=Prochlorococcus sp. MIT 1300 TaxID=3096218 RepID=UPI002A75B932|nr:methyltransferase domain-containing protein [Prochlorococcus sp. MIT 1300]